MNNYNIFFKKYNSNYMELYFEKYDRPEKGQKIASLYISN